MFNSKEIARMAIIRAEKIKTDAENRRRKLIVVTVIIGLCTALAAVEVSRFSSGDSPDYNILIFDERTPLASYLPLLPDANAVPYTANEWDALQGFRIPVYTAVSVPSNTHEAKMMLPNHDSNTCLLTFEIIMNETGETLYISGLVEPQMYIESITLKTPLAQGEYESILTIRAYEPDSLNLIGAVSMDFVLIFE